MLGQKMGALFTTIISYNYTDASGTSSSEGVKQPYMPLITCGVEEKVLPSCTPPNYLLLSAFELFRCPPHVQREQQRQTQRKESNRGTSSAHVFFGLAVAIITERRENRTKGRRNLWLE